MGPGEALSPLVFFPHLAGALALGGGIRGCLLSSCPGMLQLWCPLFGWSSMGSVAPPSDGDKCNPLALCSGSHFHFGPSLSPAKSTPLGPVFTSSRKPSLLAPGHSGFSLLWPLQSWSLMSYGYNIAKQKISLREAPFWCYHNYQTRSEEQGEV